MKNLGLLDILTGSGRAAMLAPDGVVPPAAIPWTGAHAQWLPMLPALRALGYLQRFGAGMAIARKVLGPRLSFEVQPGFVAAIVKADRL
jgi:hypothetical protein